jgi:hypothetical protein
MYNQPNQGPTMPPIIAHIYFAKPAQQVCVLSPPRGILAELAQLRRH